MGVPFVPSTAVAITIVVAVVVSRVAPAAIYGGLFKLLSSVHKIVHIVAVQRGEESGRLQKSVLAQGRLNRTYGAGEG